jgi:hypothetical protein
MSGDKPDGSARQSADALALALEDVGFDVGHAFPLLGQGFDRDGAPVVELGSVAPPVAAALAGVLADAARHGVMVSDG